MTASIPSPPSNSFDVGPLTIHYYGLLIGIGAVLAVIVARRRYEGRGGPTGVAERAGVWAVAMGLVGARLAYVSTHLDRFEGRPWAVLYVWEGGLAIFGGLLFGIAAVYVVVRRAGVGMWEFADAAAIGVPLAQAIGRWGNYFNQELYGTPTSLPWGLEIDPANRVAPYESFSTFHPTFLYESIWNLGLVGVLLWLDHARVFRAPGSILFAYLAGYGLGRFLIELIRTDTTFRLLGLSRNNWVALLVCVGASSILFLRERAARRAPGPAELGAPEGQAG